VFYITVLHLIAVTRQKFLFSFRSCPSYCTLLFFC